MALRSEEIWEPILNWVSDDKKEELNSYELDGMYSIEGIHNVYNKFKSTGQMLTDFEDDLWTMTDFHYRYNYDFSKVDDIPLIKDHFKYKECLKLLFVIMISSSKYKYAIDFANWMLKAGVCQVDNWEKTIYEKLSLKKKTFLHKFCLLMEHEYDLNALGKSIENAPKPAKYGKRHLCHSYYSYLFLDEEIKEFWGKANVDEKKLFGPLVLFWNVCGILPSRPEAFTLMPKDPIKIIEGKIYLATRQSHIKGGLTPPHNNVFLDDPTSLYRINKQTADYILEYKNLIEDTLTEMDCLFNNVARNELVKNQSWKCGEIFTSEHLNQLLDKFMRKICAEKGYLVKKYEGEDSVIDYNSKIIEPINLGDLRHLSMISMVYLGVDPSIIMELAGQEEIASACHYFSNSDNICNCYSVFLRMHNRGQRPKEERKTQIREDYTGLKLSVVSGGKCKNINGRLCVQYRRHIGCPNFIPDNNENYKGLLTEYSIEMESALNAMGRLKREEKKEEMREAITVIQRTAFQSRRLEELCRDI